MRGCVRFTGSDGTECDSAASKTITNVSSRTHRSCICLVLLQFSGANTTRYYSTFRCKVFHSSGGDVIKVLSDFSFGAIAGGYISLNHAAFFIVPFHKSLNIFLVSVGR